MYSALHVLVAADLSIIGALELCCRLGEMLVIQNERVDWDTHTIGIPGQTTKDKENRRIPFDPNGRVAPVLGRRGKLGPNAFVFGTENGEYVGSFKTAWESLLLIANGHETDIKQTQQYLNITDEELRKAMAGVWERRRQLRAVSQ